MTKNKYIALFTLICAINHLNAMDQFFNTLDLKRYLPMAIVPTGITMANRFVYNTRENIIKNNTISNSSSIMQRDGLEKPGSMRPYLKTAVAGTALNILFSNILFSSYSTWTSIGLGTLTSIPTWASSAYYFNKEKRLLLSDQVAVNEKKGEIFNIFGRRIATVKADIATSNANGAANRNLQELE